MCLNLPFIPWVYCCYPETTHLSLEEVDFLHAEAGVPAMAVAKRYQKEKQKKSENRTKIRRETGDELKRVVKHAESKQ